MTIASRRLVATVTMAAVLVVTGVVVGLTRSSNTTSSTNLLPTARGPAALATAAFAPPELGASLTVPASWRSVAPTSGFQYVIQGDGEFVGVAKASGFIPLTPSSLANARARFLRSRGGSILSQSTGTVDGRPAVKLHYRLSEGATSVDDTEYDIITTSTLPVGASQNQRQYTDIVIVLGSTPASTHPTSLDWIASTLRITA